MQRTQQDHPWLIIGLMMLGIVARLVPHAWNATPLTAIALLGGTYLAKRWAILLPLIIVAASDAILGWHNTILFTWAAFALTGVIGLWVRQRPHISRIATGALIGSGLFFLITNFGVWIAGELYARTLAGLQQCFIAAIPFWRNTLVGDRFSSIDLALMKHIAVASHAKLQLRVEIFNVLNTDNFFLPVGDLTKANAGQVTRAADALQIQLGARFTF